MRGFNEMAANGTKTATPMKIKNALRQAVLDIGGDKTQADAKSNPAQAPLEPEAAWAPRINRKNSA